MKPSHILAVLILLLANASVSQAQLLAAKDHPVSMGHHHLMVNDMDKNLAFWSALGGELGSKQGLPYVRFPNLFIFLTEQPFEGATSGSVVNHFGLQVSNLRNAMNALRENGFKIITEEVAGNIKVVRINDEQIAQHTVTKANFAFVLAPNGAWVELNENKQLPYPVANHHIHFHNPEFIKMKAWYVETFNAKPGLRGNLEAADLGGVNLSFSNTGTPQANIQGRALDHIGFEIKDLEAFCERLKAAGIRFDTPYHQIPSLEIAVAYLTDPWGTYIELTEGLDQL